MVEILTAPGYTWVWTSGGCTAWNGRLGMPGQRESHGTRGARPRDGAEILCMLGDGERDYGYERACLYGWHKIQNKIQHNMTWKPEASGSPTLQEVGDVLQLRDVVLPVPAVLLQQGKDAVVFPAGMCWVQGLQLLEHLSPCVLLLLRVLHPGDHLTTAHR